jgi:hypothetical protein
MGLFGRSSSSGGYAQQIEAGKTRLAKAERELRNQKATGDRGADKAIRRRIEQDISVARANVGDMGNWA